MVQRGIGDSSGGRGEQAYPALHARGQGQHRGDGSPSRRFAINEAWLELGLIGFDRLASSRNRAAIDSAAPSAKYTDDSGPLPGTSPAAFSETSPNGTNKYLAAVAASSE